MGFMTQDELISEVLDRNVFCCMMFLKDNMNNVHVVMLNLQKKNLIPHF